MNDLTSLERRIASLMESAVQRHALEREARDTEMLEVEPRRSRFESLADAWMCDLVLPRLLLLARAFPGGDVDHAGGGLGATLKFARSEERPVGASLSVSIAPSAAYERAILHVQPQIVPILAGHPAPSSREFDLTAEEPLVTAFLEDGIVAFAEAYQRVGEPGSPHQRGGLMTDPVCGMTIHRMEAAEHLEHRGRHYYFCASSCAQRFREAPERYMGLPGEHGGKP